jgi:cell division protein FtsQ
MILSKQSGFLSGLRMGSKVALVATIGVGGYWAYDMGYVDHFSQQAEDAAINASKEVGLTISSIDVFGFQRTTAQEIREVIAVEPGDAFISFDVRDLKTRIETLPWIKSAMVERRVPDQLIIVVVERTPFAIWQVDGAHWLIDDDGVPVTDRFLADFDHLPFVVGQGAPDAAGGLYNIVFENPEYAERLTAAIRVGFRRWDLEFDNGMRLRLPENSEDFGPKDAWKKFVEMQENYRVLEREIRVVDMRLKDRVGIKLTKSGLKAVKTRKKNSKT